MRICRCFLFLLIAGWSGTATDASVIGYWRLEDGAVGTEATTLTSQANSPLLDGTESGSMFFSDAIPGPLIADGIGGAVVSNTRSLYTTRTGNNYFYVDDNVNSPALHEPTSFTFELFIRADLADVSGFRVIAKKVRGNGYPGSWFLMANAGRILLRVDSNASGQSGPGWNQSIASNVGTVGSIDDGKWHHIGLTYEETGQSSSVFRLYKDYQLVGSLIPAGPSGKIVYDGGRLEIGGRSTGNGWQGWIDEVRLSSGVLSSSQFLQAVPEPASVLAWAPLAGMLLLWRRGRRRNSVATG